MIFKPIWLANICITSNTKCLQGCGPTEIFIVSGLFLPGKIFACLSLHKEPKVTRKQLPPIIQWILAMTPDESLQFWGPGRLTAEPRVNGDRSTKSPSSHWE